MKSTDEAMLVACHSPLILFTTELNEHLLLFLIAGAVGVFNSVCDPVLMGGMSRIAGEDEQGTHSKCPANDVVFN